MTEQTSLQPTTESAGVDLPAVTKDIGRQLQIVDGRVQVSTLQDAYYLCKLLHHAGMVPKDKQGQGGAEKCLAAYLYGMNVGLDIMTSVQSVAVIGNMPSVWGDAMLALVKNSKTLERWIEVDFAPLEDDEGMASICIAKRKDVGVELDIKKLREDQMAWPEIHELALLSGWFSNIYTDEDIATAGLGSKDTYARHGRRMRKMRARAFTLRDGWPDILKGIHAREEFDSDQVPGGGNSGGNGREKKDRAEDLAARIKDRPVDIKPAKVETAPSPAHAAAEQLPAEQPPAAPELSAEDKAAIEDLKAEQSREPVAKVFQDLKNREAIKNQAHVVDCPACKGSGGDEESGYCRYCGGSGKMDESQAYKLTHASTDDYLPADPAGAGEPPWHGAGDEADGQVVDAEFPGDESPPEANADTSDPKAGRMPEGDPELNRIAELEKQVKAFIRDEAGLETDKARNYWTAKVLSYLLDQCQKANAGVKKGEPPVVGLGDVYARFLRTPAENFRYVKALFDGGKPDAGSGRENLGTTKGQKGTGSKRGKAQNQNPLPGLGKEPGNTSAEDELAKLKARTQELKAKDTDRLAKAAKALQMSTNPLTAEGFRRLLAEYDRLVLSEEG